MSDLFLSHAALVARVANQNPMVKSKMTGLAPCHECDVRVVKMHNGHKQHIWAELFPAEVKQVLFSTPGDTEEQAMLRLAQLVLGDTAFIEAKGRNLSKDDRILDYIGYQPDLAAVEAMI